MKQALTQRLNPKKPKIMDGFSYIVLWPCYLVFSGSLLVATTKLDAFVGSLIVILPAFVLTIVAAAIFEERRGTNGVMSGDELQQIFDDYQAYKAPKPKAPKTAHQPKYTRPINLTPSTSQI